MQIFEKFREKMSLKNIVYFSSKSFGKWVQNFVARFSLKIMLLGVIRSGRHNMSGSFNYEPIYALRNAIKKIEKL